MVRRRGIRRTVCATALAIATLAAVTGSAQAHFAYFTGERYYCGGSASAPNGGGCRNLISHSWWFNSATYKGSGTVRVCSGVSGAGPYGGNTVCGNNLARTCLGGQVYPNCHDVDGFSNITFVTNESAYAHTIQGHAMY